ncbi:MAG TPA: DUF6159 family protein [Mycobacterium sp.]|nr:DUF6159 family protein [Mycobacterium sp.]
MERISRGWALTKQSWGVLKSDRSLVIFPMLSAIFALIAVAVIWLPTASMSGVLAGEAINEHDPVYYIAAAATAYVSTFIAVFFNVALAACAVRSLRGEDTTVGEGIRAAMQRLGPILGWTLVAATIGLVLRLLQDRIPLAAKIAVWIAGAAWAVATFFVIPVLALERSGPWQSIKRSVAVVKARWGEGATGTVAISAVTGLVVVIVMVGGAACGIVLFAAGLQQLAIAVIAIAVAAVIVVSIVSSALTEIFRVAVYQYAVTGATPGAFDNALLQNAFDGRTHQR